jgi:glycosyltransferase involved in cell wall biosynthesis/GNAT superfamily N-acetyltransferase
MLRRLLESLAVQETGTAFDLEIVVTDNDEGCSAEAVTREFAKRFSGNVSYDCEPEQNIAMARNRCARNARGNFIAYIDDDEYSKSDWLLQLYRVQKQFSADGVQGPVLPDFPPRAPLWLRRSGLCDRTRWRTGTVTSLGDARTGNVLFRRDLFRDGELWFDPKFGKTGGEDGDFFRRQGNRGAKFYWCDEAITYETVPESRWTLSFYLRRTFRIGTLYAGLIRRGELPRRWMLAKSLVFFCGLMVLIPVLPLTGKRVWSRALVKMSYCAGYVLGFCGIVLLTERPPEMREPSTAKSMLSRLRWYLRKHGPVRLAQLALQKFTDRCLRRSEYVFCVDLTRSLPSGLVGFEPIEVEPYRSIEEIPEEILLQVCAIKGQLVAMPFLKRYFGRKGRLWLGKGQEGHIVGLQWTVQGGFDGFYSLPIPDNDVIMVAIETFREFRGHAYFQKLMHAMLRQLKAEGLSRLYFKVHAHNWPMLKAVHKAGFAPIGRVTTLMLPFRHVSVWRGQFSLPGRVTRPVNGAQDSRSNQVAVGR